LDSGGTDTSLPRVITSSEITESLGYRLHDVRIDEAPVDDTVLGGTPWCIRCGTKLDWRHSSWQCPKCKYKEGCCG
jgi:rubrerythrin